MPIIDIVAPAVEPIVAADVKASARIDGTEFDGQIAIIIPALRRRAEGMLGRRLINQTVELVIDRFPECEVDLQLPDASSVVSVKYRDTGGLEQTMLSTEYSLDSSSHTCWLFPAYGQRWPETIDAANAVRVRFIAGFGADAASVPAEIRLWMIARAVQALSSPDFAEDAQYKTSPFLDGLLDRYKIWPS